MALARTTYLFFSLLILCTPLLVFNAGLGHRGRVLGPSLLWFRRASLAVITGSLGGLSMWLRCGRRCAVALGLGLLHSGCRDIKVGTCREGQAEGCRLVIKYLGEPAEEVPDGVVNSDECAADHTPLDFASLARLAV